MGLDFSHCDAHWAYSGFMRFRMKLAEEVGLKDYPRVAEERPEEFLKFENDPIFPLLNHSDCDGELTPEECRTVAPRLRQLVSSWGDEDMDKGRAIQLSEGMELAAADNESLVFQ